MVLRFGLVLLAGVIALGVCSSSGPDCSAENVISTVKKIDRQKIATHPGLIYVFDFEASRYEVNAIRTRPKAPSSALARQNFALCRS